MSRYLSAASGLLLGLAVLVAVARIQGMTLPWQSATCGDPTGACWTRGQPVYIAQIHKNYTTSSSAGYLQTVVSRVLNTGPDIPNLVVVIHPDQGKVLSLKARIDTPSGSRTIVTHPIHREHSIQWRLGPVPDGDVVTINSRYSHTGTDITWMQPTFYGRVPRHGSPSARWLVQADPAILRP